MPIKRSTLHKLKVTVVFTICENIASDTILSERVTSGFLRSTIMYDNISQIETPGCQRKKSFVLSKVCILSMIFRKLHKHLAT